MTADNSAFVDFFAQPEHRAQRETLPLLCALVDRYRDERPFDGATVVLGHVLVRNTMLLAEALLAGGADLMLAAGYRGPAAEAVIADLARFGVRVLPNAEAVTRGDLYVDVGCLLGRLRTPRGAAEVTRSGVMHYLSIPCPVVSADDCKAKRIEGFFGTGDGFVRAWHLLRPDDPLEGRRIVQFGYGKIGRGAAFRSRVAGAEVTIVDVSPAARQRALTDGFVALPADPAPELQAALKAAGIILTVTSIANLMSENGLPPDWLRAGGAVLVNLGAEDEYGPAFADHEILGNRHLPLNFHLDSPTLNRYVDPPLAAHVMALEALLAGDYAHGVHPLPQAMDAWLLSEWRKAWPDEDLTGIGAELGLPEI